jgi:hypothetical protein
VSFPVGASTITVTGTFPVPAGGAARSGKVVFTPSAVLVDSTQHAIYSGAGSATITSGSFTIVLLCTDDTDVQPTGWRWRVDEQPSGGQRRTYYIDLPHTLGSTVDLSTLSPVSAPDGSGHSLPPTGPAGGALTGSYPNPQLSAATIGSFDPAGAASAAQAAAISAAATDATSKVATHSADTTGVHGIADTANLVVTTDSRLSDARTPTAHAASHAAVGSDPVSLSQSQVSGLVAALAALLSKTGGTVTGDLIVDGANLTVTRADDAGAYRLRVTGGGLDFEIAGLDVTVSHWQNADFTGTQSNVMRWEAAGPHLIGRTQFGTSPFDTVHDLDAGTGVAAIGKKNSLSNIRFCGRRASTGAPTSGTWSVGDTVQDSAGALWLCTAGGTPGTWVGGGATSPWVFDVTSYGALGNGKVASDAAMTSGSAVLTCSTSTPFAAGDVGKNVMVLGAGASGETLVGTISAYTDSSHVTLSATAGSSVSGVPAMWASDDTAAIQATIDAAVTYAQAHAGAATVLIPTAAGAFYGVAGPLKTGGSTLGNAQLTLPVVAATGRKLTLTIQGAHTGAGVQHWQQLVPNTTGSTLVSFGLFANATAQTNSINAGGNPAVIGGPSQPGGYGVAPGNFSNLYVDIGDLSILTCHSKFGLTYTAIDLSGVANAQLRDGQTSTTGVVAPPAGSYVSPGVFATGLSIGILLPANGNNDCTILRNWTIGGGYTYGLLATEHTDIYGLRILYCWAALCPVGTYYSSVGAAHSINGSLISIEQCTYLIYVFGPGTGGLGPTMYLKIDTETSTPRFGDRTGGTGLAAARGEVVLAGLFTPSGLTLDNPTGLKIRNSQLTYPIATKTSSYTATSFDEHILADATSGAVTITLPTAVGRTDPITVKKIDSSINAVTIDGAGTETIDGQLTRRLDAQWDYCTLVPSGSSWYVKAAPTAISWADRPSEQGLLAWTYDPNMAGHVTAQSNAGVAGRITLVKIPIREQITWSSIWFGLSGVDAGATLSNCYLGVYDSSGTLKGTTADISSSLMSGATAKSVALTSSFTAAPGSYFIAMLLNGTWTTNSLTFKASGAGVSVNAGLTAPNLRYSNILTSQTSLPSSLTLSGQATNIINTGWASQWYGVS